MIDIGEKDTSIGRAVQRADEWSEAKLAEPQHGDRVAALLGISLAISFTVCFLTGLLSHAIQHPPTWFTWWPRPAGSYRITEGLHVATGLAAIPLLFAKLWSVFPRLFRRPMFDDALHLIERISLVPLVGGALFMLLTGLANIDLWYPWSFFFPAGHYAVSWVVIGALIVHIAAKATITRQALRRPVDEPPARGTTRRRFLGYAGAASAVVVVTTVGQTVSPLSSLALLAPRRPDLGTQAFPVNRTAVKADVVDSSKDPAYRLTVMRDGKSVASFSVADLSAMAQRSADLPISCVEGWSASRVWTGVPLSSVLAAAGIDDANEVSVGSLEKSGRYRSSIVNDRQLDDMDTLLALQVNGEQLHPDHGYPVRLIGPARPGVLQTKWVDTLEVR